MMGATQMGGRSASIVIRGVSLWLLIHAIAGVASVFQQWHEEDVVKQTQVLITLVSTLLPMATALLVWANADWLAKRVASVETDMSAIASWSPQDLLRLVVATVGLVTLVQALTDLVWYSSVFVSMNWSRNTALGPVSASDDLRSQFWDVSGKANFASTVGRTVLGLLLVLKPSSIASLVGRAEVPSENAAISGSHEGVQQGDEADEA